MMGCNCCRVLYVVGVYCVVVCALCIMGSVNHVCVLRCVFVVCTMLCVVYFVYDV